MSKTWTFIIGSLVGLIVGGVLTFFIFVGAPEAAQKPGVPLQKPDPNGNPPATAQIVLKQDFFNEVLKTIFRDMSAPAFPLALNENREAQDSVVPSYAALQNSGCDGKITLLPEGSGVASALNFEEGRIVAPLAFNGSYNSMFGCLRFSGWTKANLELRFDPNQQNVLGQLNIETVNLDGGAGMLGGIVAPLVQRTLNDRVNPIQILQGSQIALNLPIAATNGNMRATVKDVRSEIKDNALNLFVIYEFSGAPATQNAF
jgi:hypothetical protein